MKSSVLVLFVMLVVGLFFASTTNAQGDENITQEKIAHIREHCVENQASLNRLRQNDAFLRTDRGTLYRTISDKLMVPFNQRLVSNRLDGAQLIAISADFTDEYDRFYAAYVNYASSLTQLLAIDCSRQPVTFYSTLLKTRANRSKLAESNQKLKTLVRQYGDAFKAFEAEYRKEHP